MLESQLMEETYNKWPKWQKVYTDIKHLTPRGLSLPRESIILILCGLVDFTTGRFMLCLALLFVLVFFFSVRF